jgi:hypothetical protein
VARRCSWDDELGMESEDISSSFFLVSLQSQLGGRETESPAACCVTRVLLLPCRMVRSHDASYIEHGDEKKLKGGRN